MKLPQMIQLSQVFNSLMAEKLPHDVSYKIRVNMKAIGPNLEAYEAARIEAVKNNTHGDDAPHWDMIAEELKPLLEIDHDIKLLMAKESQFSGIALTLGQLAALEPMIEDDMGNVVQLPKAAATA